MSLSRTELKNAFACWATGVTVVTSRADERIHGMTVSAFTEVSLEPPLVLVCVDKASSTQTLIAEAGVFAVNILARDQERLSERFASKEDEERRFADLEYATGMTGSPLLSGTVANLDCRLVATHDGGDHIICVGEVVELRVSDSEPLMFYRRTYRGLSG